MTRRSKLAIGLAMLAPAIGWADDPIAVMPVEGSVQPADSLTNRLRSDQAAKLVPLSDEASRVVTPALRWGKPTADSTDIPAEREQSEPLSPDAPALHSDGDWVPRIPTSAAWAVPERTETVPLIAAWADGTLFPWVLPASFPAGNDSNRPKSTFQIIVSGSGAKTSISDSATEGAEGPTLEISPKISADLETSAAESGLSLSGPVDSRGAGAIGGGELGEASAERAQDAPSRESSETSMQELPANRPGEQAEPMKLRRPKISLEPATPNARVAVRPGRAAGLSESFIGDLGQDKAKAVDQDLTAEGPERAEGDAGELSDAERSELSSDEMRELSSDADDRGAETEAAPTDAGDEALEPTDVDEQTEAAGRSPSFIGDRITAAGELVLSSPVDTPKLELSSRALKVKPVIERGLKYYWDRPEDAAIRTHWGMMHSIMVFDKDTEIIDRQKRYNAVAWMAGNNPCRNQILFSEDEHGIAVRTGPGLQGHQGQLLAIFGQIDVPVQYPVYAGKKQFTVRDILQREMEDCKTGNELTFTLIGLAHYADSDSSWIARDGESWNVERVIREELKQPIVGAACGGTHRLMGFGHALRRRRAEGKPITGEWDRADRFIKDFVDYTWTLQNRDGSMSTAWFEHREDNGKVDRKIQTTGHMLEMLMVVTPDDQLQSPQLLRTAEFLANTMYSERGHDWEVGPKGHALRSLAMYYQRVFRDPTPWRNAPVERSTSRPRPTVRSVR